MGRNIEKNIKVLYIGRDYKRSWKSAPKKVIGGVVKNLFYYFGIEGFFEESLSMAFKVKKMSAKKAINKAGYINKKYSIIFVDHACQLGHRGQGTYDRLVEVASFFTIPKGSFSLF